MFDFIHLPNKETHNTWYDFAGGSSQFWIKPKGCTMVYMIGCGGGGAGGRGYGASAGTIRTGGGGGGPGALTALLIPAKFIPDVLVVTIGAGGVGNTTGAGGTGGTTSVGPFGNLSSAASLIITAGGAGGAGGSTSNATGGAAGSTGNTGAYCLGIFKNLESGPSGTAGGITTGSAGTDVSAANLIDGMIFGGAGGASIGANNVVYNGGGIVASNRVPAIPGGSSAGTLRGIDGIFYKDLKLFYPGTGGASSYDVTGGDGGTGSPGCGGGGGGGGFATSSRGGDGGPGFVQIICW